MDSFTIDELSIPASIDDPDAADFIEMAYVRNEVEAEVVGNRDLAYTAAELLPNWQDPYQPRRLMVARADGHIVGRASYHAPVEEGSKGALLTVEVLPRYRRRGIGAALYDVLAGFAADQGRTVLQTYLIHPNTGGERIPSPTGFGSLPLNSPETRFLLERRFRLEQVERMSRLALPVNPDTLASQLTAAADAAGPDYRIVAWVGRTSERWLSDLATLHARMSTDAPSAGLDVTPEKWDADRLRTIEDNEESSPRTTLFATVEHVPTGRLVAFNKLSVPPELNRAVEQQDTLVFREHRGHRLGMLVKAANLVQLENTHPGHPSVITFNAEENRHMLDVNEAVGFVPVGYGGGWKKIVTESA